MSFKKSVLLPYEVFQSTFDNSSKIKPNNPTSKALWFNEIAKKRRKIQAEDDFDMENFKVASISHYFKAEHQPIISTFLEVVKNSKDKISWNTKTQELKIKGKVYPGSNIVDILRYLILKGQSFYSSAGSDGIPIETRRLVQTLRELVKSDSNLELFQALNFNEDRVDDIFPPQPQPFAAVVATPIQRIQVRRRPRSAPLFAGTPENPRIDDPNYQLNFPTPAESAERNRQRETVGANTDDRNVNGALNIFDDDDEGNINRALDIINEQESGRRRSRRLRKRYTTPVPLNTPTIRQQIAKASTSTANADTVRKVLFSSNENDDAEGDSTDDAEDAGGDSTDDDDDIVNFKLNTPRSRNSAKAQRSKEKKEKEKKKRKRTVAQQSAEYELRQSKRKSRSKGKSSSRR